MVNGEIKQISIHLKDIYKNRLEENYKSCISELANHFSDKFKEILFGRLIESLRNKVTWREHHERSLATMYFDENKFTIDCEIILAMDIESAINRMLEDSIINVEEKETKQCETT